jgi:hypothetical protein
MKTTLPSQIAPLPTSHASGVAKKPLALLAGLVLASLQPLGAAVIPYTNDFSGTGANTAFTSENTNAEWAVSGGSYVFNYTNTTITPSTASLSITNASATSFTMETQFTVTSNMLNVNSNGATIGFGLFGASTTFAGSGTATSYYLADFSVANSTGTPGTLRILSLGDTAGFTAINGSADDNTGSAALAIVQNTTYTLRLEGTYSGTTLNMTLGLYDAAGTAQIGSDATASDTSPLAGTNFGYRNRIGIGTGAFTANFDNFSIVPEPGTLGLLALGGAAVLAVRRRRDV